VPFKFKAVPEAGEIVLSDEEAKSKPPNSWSQVAE